MKPGYVLDSNGLFHYTTWVEDNVTNAGNVIVTSLPQGLNRPKWSGTGWVEGETADQELQRNKAIMKAQAQQRFGAAVAAGFSSMAYAGTAYQYAIDPQAMQKWTGILALINAGTAPAQIYIKALDGTKVFFDHDAFKQFAGDGFAYYNQMENNLWTNEENIDAATTMNELNQVVLL